MLASPIKTLSVRPNTNWQDLARISKTYQDGAKPKKTVYKSFHHIVCIKSGLFELLASIVCTAWQQPQLSWDQFSQTGYWGCEHNNHHHITT
jgi:hypothetical protein